METSRFYGDVASQRQFHSLPVYLQSQVGVTSSSIATSTTTTISSSFSSRSPIMGTGYSVMSSSPSTSQIYSSNPSYSQEFLNEVFALVMQKVSSALNSSSSSSLPVSQATSATSDFVPNPIFLSSPPQNQVVQSREPVLHYSANQVHNSPGQHLPQDALTQQMYPPLHRAPDVQPCLSQDVLQQQMNTQLYNTPDVQHQQPFLRQSYSCPSGGSSVQISQVPQDQLQPRSHQLRGCQSKKNPHGGSLDFLYNAHVKFPQYRALDFIRICNFPFSSEIEESDMNLALFSLGSLKHLLALLDGTLPSVNSLELMNRVQHLVNIYEIVCLGSEISDFRSHSWDLGFSYNSRVIHDLETGIKSWNTLSRSIDPTCYAYAKESLEHSKNESHNFSSSGNVKKCTSWNTFHREGCQYEYLHPGQTCKYQHSCSICFANGLGNLPHKAWECDENNQHFNNDSNPFSPSLYDEDFSPPFYDYSEDQ